MKLARVVLAAIAALSMASVAIAQDTTEPPASEPTPAFVLAWPAYQAGTPPLLHIDGGGLLQLLILAPEVLEIVQGAAAGVDVKTKAELLVQLIEQSKGEAADPTIVCAPQAARISDLEEQLEAAQTALASVDGQIEQAQEAAEEAEAARVAAETKAAEAEARAAAAEAQLAELAGKVSAAEHAAQDAARAQAQAEQERAAAEGVLATVRRSIGSAAEALKTVADALGVGEPTTN